MKYGKRKINRKPSTHAHSLASKSTRQINYLLLYLDSEALEERLDLLGSPAVERKASLTAALAGPAEPPGEAGGPTVRAEDEATVCNVEAGLDLAGCPSAEVAVKPDGRHPVMLT